MTTVAEVHGTLRIELSESAGSAGTRYYAKVWFGRSLRPAYYQFRTAEHRAKYIADTKEGADRAAEMKARRAAERKAVQAADFYAVGDILHYSWGWEQTNCEFYEVLAVGPKSITIDQIGSQLRSAPGLSSMAGYLTPNRGFREGKPMTKRVGPGGVVRMASYGWATKWDGHPKYTSWYG